MDGLRPLVQDGPRDGSARFAHVAIAVLAVDLPHVDVARGGPRRFDDARHGGEEFPAVIRLVAWTAHRLPDLPLPSPLGAYRRVFNGACIFAQLGSEYGSCPRSNGPALDGCDSDDWLMRLRRRASWRTFALPCVERVHSEPRQRGQLLDRVLLAG